MDKMLTNIEKLPLPRTWLAVWAWHRLSRLAAVMWKLESGQAKTWGKGAVPSTIFTPPILCLSLRELITPPTYLKADCDNSKRFIEYLLEREDVKEAWLEHTEHAFVAGLADGTLPLETFKYYLIQDYLYLVSHNTKLSGTDVD
ncbi:hypothetical protein LTR04_003424, partial [Oleoguttula sp. CCFEE 6159]